MHCSSGSESWQLALPVKQYVLERFEVLEYFLHLNFPIHLLSYQVLYIAHLLLAWTEHTAPWAMFSQTLFKEGVVITQAIFYVVDLPLYFDFPTPEYTNDLNYFKLFLLKICSE